LKVTLGWLSAVILKIFLSGSLFPENGCGWRILHFFCFAENWPVLTSPYLFPFASFASHLWDSCYCCYDWLTLAFSLLFSLSVWSLVSVWAADPRFLHIIHCAPPTFWEPSRWSSWPRISIKVSLEYGECAPSSFLFLQWVVVELHWSAQRMSKSGNDCESEVWIGQSQERRSLWKRYFAGS
jgi:hypothetical protein